MNEKYSAQLASQANIGSIKVPRDASREQQEELYRQRWELAEVRLEPGEYAVQMVKHNPGYFITNHARVFSVKRNYCFEKMQFTGMSSGVKKTKCTIQQLRVGLSIDGRLRFYRLSRLVSEYFDISVFNPSGTENVHCHHIEPYVPEKGTENNHSDNLQMVGADMHLRIFDRLKNGTVTDEGMQLKDEKGFWKQLAGIQTDQSFMVISEADKETGTVTGVRGLELSQEQEEQLLQNPLVQQAICEVYRQWADELGKDVEAHPEKYRIVDGIPELIDGEAKIVEKLISKEKEHENKESNERDSKNQTMQGEPV